LKRCAFVISVLLVFASLGPACAATGDLRYASPGQRFSAGHMKLNFYCSGTGSPTVVFDAGWEDWSPAWATIQPAVSRYTRTCAYDRAGSGFSDAGPMPRTSVAIARELHAALHGAGIPGPYLLVGHSFGGYNIRAFADLYLPEVYGAVFVDIESGDLESPKDQADDNRAFAADVAELGECGKAVATHRPLPSLPTGGHSFTPAPHTPCSHQFFRELPMKEWSPELNAAVLHIANTRPALYDAVISEMNEMPFDARWLTVHRRVFGDRPLRVLTAQNHNYDTAKTPVAVHRKHLADEREWAQTQRRYLSLSTDSKQTLVPNSGHYIQFDQPQIVLDAIRSEVVHP
jgi:pimeloyl-ACP methyl ester carboxylesterase